MHNAYVYTCIHMFIYIYMYKYVQSCARGMRMKEPAVCQRPQDLGGPADTSKDYFACRAHVPESKPGPPGNNLAYFWESLVLKPFVR